MRLGVPMVPAGVVLMALAYRSYNRRVSGWGPTYMEHEQRQRCRSDFSPTSFDLGVGLKPDLQN